jgi:hypothetical protein
MVASQACSFRRLFCVRPRKTFWTSDAARLHVQEESRPETPASRREGVVSGRNQAGTPIIGGHTLFGQVSRPQPVWARSETFAHHGRFLDQA